MLARLCCAPAVARRSRARLLAPRLLAPQQELAQQELARQQQLARQSSSSSSSAAGAVPSTLLYGEQELPARCRVVVVGGGIIGNAVAYHLGKRGWGPDVVLLERDRVTSGTTWHAAGLMVTFGSLSETSTELRKYSKQLYRDLERETGQSTGFKGCGFIEIATSADYVEEFRRVAAFNRFHGVDVREISPAEVRALFPLCNVDDVLAGFYVPTDGRVNPVDACTALSKGARQQGVRMFEGVSCAEVLSESVGDGARAVRGVRTSGGREIACDVVVNCSGMWARQLAERVGACVPNQAAEHYYFLTGPVPGVTPDLPVVEDPSRFTYIRPETNGGLLVGLFEPGAAAWGVERVPQDFSFGEIQPDMDRVLPFLEAALGRVPAARDAGLSKLFCGPESFTPDLAPVVGEAPAMDNYFVAAGLNSIGILSGPGVGRALADWVVDGKPSVDVTAMHPARFEAFQCAPRYRADRVAETLGRVYTCHYPHHHMESARGAKESPLHERLARAGALFRPVSGFEGADWFDPDGAARGRAPEQGPLSWGRERWFPLWRDEHAAVRQECGLIDMSFMAKFLVQGPDAGRALNRLSTADVDGDEAGGRITYTQWLDEDGLVQADVTVAKCPPHVGIAGGPPGASFLVVATDTMNGRVEAYLRRQLRRLRANAHVTNVTGGLAQINVQGPRSRELLQRCTTSDLSDAALPFRAFRDMYLGYARLHCARITYVGELGYELFVPAEQARHVYDTLFAAAAREPALPLRNVGLKALGSLRMEKGYRDYGHDVDNMDAIANVGLAFTCDYDKPHGFIGLEATQRRADEAKRRGGLLSRLLQVQLLLPGPLMFHAEVVHRDGVPLGTVRSASYGHTLGGAVGLAMLHAREPITQALLDRGTWAVDVAGTMVPAKVSLKPLYDPSNKRIKS